MYCVCYAETARLSAAATPVMARTQSQGSGGRNSRSPSQPAAAGITEMEVEEAIAIEPDGPGAFLQQLQMDIPEAPVDPDQNRRNAPFSALQQ